MLRDGLGMRSLAFFFVIVLGAVVSEATTVTIQAGLDTYVVSNAPNNNFGNSQIAYVGRHLSKNSAMRGLLHFDLSALPAAAIINAATLRFFIDATSSDPISIDLSVRRLQGSFVEGNGSSGATWNTQPDVVASPTNAGTMTSVAGGWFAMDLEALTLAALESGAPDDLWLRVAATNEDPATGSVHFRYRTKEHGTGAERAELIIDYTVPAGEPIIDLLINAPTVGTISYNGTGGPLAGTNVSVDAVVGVNTPLHTGETLDCVSCVLSFASGNLESSDEFNWYFGSGGSITLTGGIDLDDNGTIGAGDVPLGTVILSGSFSNAFVLSVGDTFRILGGGLTDEKVSALTDFFGTPSSAPYGGSINISFSSSADPPAGFTSQTLHSGDLSNVPQGPTPTPTPTHTPGGPTSTPIPTPTFTPTFTPTNTPTHTPTSTPTNTQAPAADPSRIIAWDVVNGEATVAGLGGSVAAGAQVTVTNTRTGQHVVVTANGDGSFTTELAAEERDVLSIVVGVGNPSAPVTVDVLPPAPDLVAPVIDRTVATTVFDSTAFLYQPPFAIQVGMSPSEIVPERSAVVRGQVLDTDGNPLTGVKITVLNHPEYGYTLSRSDGAFDLAVNGGELLTVQYERDDTFTAQRKVEVPWQDYAFLPDVILTEPDPQKTSRTFSSSAPLQTAEGSTEGQGTESRTGFLVFPPGVEVTTIFPGETVPPTSLDVRITEYTVDEARPEAMPGELPPASAYTYAFEVSADEAIEAGVTRVDFTEPLPFYVENFIGFPVGMAIPLGSYDLEEARWEPAPNGVVLKIIGEPSGMASLDTNGDGVAESDTALENLGITTEERQALAQRYQTNDTLWRLSLSFFSRWDANWPGGAPSDAGPPNGGLPSGTNDRERLDDPDVSPSGDIVFQNQAIRKNIDIVGTPFGLTYESDRQLDRATLNTMTIPLSGPTVPASLLRIELDIEVGGRLFQEVFTRGPGEPASVLANRTTTFTWDGMNAYGRLLQGWQSVNAEVRFVYPRVYDQPAQDPAAFGLASGVAISGFTNTRAEITSGVRFDGMIGGWDAKEEGLGGWSLDVHRSYDPVRAMLNGGDGTQRTSGQIEPVIRTVVGGGTKWPIVDGVTRGVLDPSTTIDQVVSLEEPWGVAVGPDGLLYFADQNVNRRRVFRLNANGTVSTVAGGGSTPAPTAPASIAATTALLAGPSALAFGPDGFLYVSESEGHRVCRIDLQAQPPTITRVAGTGTQCFTDCGIGGNATSAKLSNPSGLAVGRDGTLYIADSGSRVLAVGTDGKIRRVAGGGSNVGTDEIPATQANFFNGAMDVALAENGALYVTSGFERVRRVDPDGRIYTVAGTGAGGDTGDGFPATQATVNSPWGLALDAEGGLFLVDAQNAQRVRRVSPEGIMTAVVSKRNNGTGFTGERGPAPAAKLHEPHRAAVGPDGSLYVSDGNNHRIRKVSSPLPGFATIGDIVVASRDGTEIYVFNTRGKHKHTVDAITGVRKYAFAYDPEGRLASVTELPDSATPRTTTITRGANEVILTGPDAQVTTITLDPDTGYVQSIENPDGDTTQFVFSNKGRLTSLTDPENHTTDYTYDTDGRLTLATYPPESGSDALTRTAVPVNNGSGYLVIHTTGEGVETGYQVELLPSGNQQRTTFFPNDTELVVEIGVDGREITTQPTGVLQTMQQGPDPRFGMQAAVDQTTTVTTPDDGLTANITSSRTAPLSNPADPFSFSTHTETVIVNGRQVTRTYTAATHSYTDTSPENRQTVTVLDADNRPTQQQVGNLTPTIFSYNDPNGRLTEVAQGTRVNTIEYDPDGNVESVTDSANRTVSFEYDGAGRVTTQTLPDLRTIGLTYDNNGNVTSITPPGRPAHEFAYSPTSLPLIYAPPNVTSPLSEPRTFYDYNLSGQLAAIDRPGPDDLSLTYDPVTGDLIDQSWSTGQRGFVYDQDSGNLELITYPGGSLTYTYDGSLLKSETWAGTVAGSVGRTYDNSSRVKQVRVNGANPVEYTYDNDDLLIATDNDPSTVPDDFTLTRSLQTGLLESTTLGVVTDSYGYNSFGEVTSYTASVGGSPIFSVSYTRDALGRIEAKTETIQGVTDTYEYDYDPAGRLTGVTKNSIAVAHYEYDSNGNRIGGFHQATGTLLSATYDAQDRLISAQSSVLGPQSWTYTDNGELTIKTDASGTATYNYDLLGNLTHVELPNGDDIEYVIDGRDRRIGKKINGILVVRLLFDGQLTPIAELDGTGQVVGRFVYASKPNVPDYAIRGGTTYRIVSDHLGSPRLVIDPSGTVVQRTDYDEFGNVLFEDIDPGFQRLPFGFAGGLYDPQIGLTRFGARDYDSATGRWTAKDPIEFNAGDTNLFAYVRNNPTTWVDSSGLVNSIELSESNAIAGTLRGIDQHALMRIIQREVRPIQILRALRNPRRIVGPLIDDIGRVSYRWTGKDVILVFNEAQEILITVLIP